ncbi:hypothetical protein L9F63_023491, partial [Diploptera punctata]
KLVYLSHYRLFSNSYRITVRMCMSLYNCRFPTPNTRQIRCSTNLFRKVCDKSNFTNQRPDKPERSDFVLDISKVNGGNIARGEKTAIGNV